MLPCQTPLPLVVSHVCFTHAQDILERSITAKQLACDCSRIPQRVRSVKQGGGMTARLRLQGRFRFASELPCRHQPLRNGLAAILYQCKHLVANTTCLHRMLIVHRSCDKRKIECFIASDHTKRLGTAQHQLNNRFAAAGAAAFVINDGMYASWMISAGGR